jgi:hypothetical protein
LAPVIPLLPTPAYASLTIARIMPMSTNTTIAACIQIQVGDMIGHASYAEDACPGEISP